MAVKGKKRGVTWRNEAVPGRPLANVRLISRSGRSRPMAGQLAKLQANIKEYEAKIKMYKLLLKTATYDPMLVWRYKYHIDNYQGKANAAQARKRSRRG
jgi:hypothetical protein